MLFRRLRLHPLAVLAVALSVSSPTLVAAPQHWALVQASTAGAPGHLLKSNKPPSASPPLAVTIAIYGSHRSRATYAPGLVAPNNERLDPGYAAAAMFMVGTVAMAPASAATQLSADSRTTDATEGGRS
jgi:hypothetical protein